MTEKKKEEYELKKLALQSKLKTSNDCSPASSSGKQQDLLKVMTHSDGTGDIIIGII